MPEPADDWRALLDRLLAAKPGERLSLLRIDQFERWQRGERLPVEAYFTHLADLRLDDETTVDLIYSEVLLRAEAGEQPTLNEYLLRFPRHEALLRQQFELMEGISENVSLTGSQAASNTVALETLRANGKANSHEMAPVGTAISPPGYEILEELGRGGMGIVYLARQCGLDRLVALKMIRGDDPGDTLARERFRREAATAARLSHPHIVQIHEVGEHEGRPFFSLEFCDGGSLSASLNRRPLPPRAAAELVEQLARAVQFAHQHGVIHRDLKPANILLSAERGARSAERGEKTTPRSALRAPRSSEATPKIADFGLARQSENNGATLGSLSISGTPAYMAPEQAAGQAVGPSVDIHGLGTILYELLTGRPPFQAATILQTLEHVRTREPTSPSSLRSNVHRDLDTICLKCLRKEPAKRYASAGELADDLRRFLRGEPIQARPISGWERAWRWSRRHPGLIGLTAVCAVTVFALVFGSIRHEALLQEAEAQAERALRETEAEHQMRRASQRAERTERYYSLLHRARQQGLSRPRGWTNNGLDLLRQACAIETTARDPAELRGEAAILHSGFDLAEETPLVEGFYVGAAALQPGGSLLALGQFKAAGWAVISLRLLDLSGKQKERTLSFLADGKWSLAHGVQDGVRSLAFSRDGKALFAGMRSGWVYRWNLENLDEKPFGWQAHDASVDVLAATKAKEILTASREKPAVFRWGLRSQGPRLLASHRPAHLNDVTLSPDGDMVACLSEHRLHFLGFSDLKPLHPELPRNGDSLAYSPDGRMLVMEEDGKLLVLDPQTREVTRTIRDPDESTVHKGILNHLAFSPDGTLLATACNNEADRKVKLWDLASGRLLTKLMPARDGSLCPTFTPDGRGLLITGDRKVQRFRILGRDLCTVQAMHVSPIMALALGEKSLACVTEHSFGPGRNTIRAEQTVWERGTGRRLARHFFELPHEHRSTPSMAFGPGDAWLGWCTSASQIQIRESKGAERRTWPVEVPSCVTVSPDGSRLWAVEKGTRVEAWDATTFERNFTWTNLSTEGLPQVYSLAVGRRWVVAGGRDGRVDLLQIGGEQRVSAWSGPGGAIGAAALTPDESLAALGTQSGRVRLVKVPTGETVADLPTHEDVVESVTFDGTGTLLAVGSRDRSVRLYWREGDTWRSLLALRALPGPVRSLRLSPDATTLAVLIDGESALRVWDLEQLRRRCEELGIGW